MVNGISIIILNYNGYDLISRLLKSLFPLSNNSSFKTEIIVIDDNSSHNDTQLIHKNFPFCKIIKTLTNNGFVKNCNKAARYAMYELLLFLNNDMELIHIDIEEIIKAITRPDVFAISPQILRPYEEFKNETVSLFIFKNGKVESENVGLHSKYIEFVNFCSIGWACGGCMFVLKSRFDELGGFDEIFAPIYVEDNDICYRAWKLGYKNLYLSGTVFYHYANSTMNKLMDNKRLVHLVTRNRFLFFWKNISDPLWLLRHIFYIIIVFFKFDKPTIRAFFGALKRIHKIKFSKRKMPFTDKYIQKEYNYFTLIDKLPVHIKKHYNLINPSQDIILKIINFLPSFLKKSITEAFENKLGWCFKPPRKLTICPSTICNYKCALCPAGYDNGEQRTKQFLKMSVLKKIMEEIGDNLESIDFYNWGEPFLNPDLPEMLRYIKICSPKIHLIVSTNASVVSEDMTKKILTSGLDELWFSIDGADPESYSKYRINGNFTTAYNNMLNFVQLKKVLKSDTHLQWRYHVNRYNEHLIDKAKKMADNIGIEIFFGIIRTQMGSELVEPIEKAIDRYGSWIPVNENYSGYDLNNKKRKWKTNCDRIFWESVINSNGSVSPCCCVWEEKFDYGNIIKEPFMKIWNNKKFRLSRLALKGKNIQNDLICVKCKSLGYRHM